MQFARQNMGRFLAKHGLQAILLLQALGTVPQATAFELALDSTSAPPVELHSFVELRAGTRTQRDPHEKDVSVLDTRLQAELYTSTRRAEYKYKGDLWTDGVTERLRYENREAWFFSRPLDWIDLKLGRQVLTWGTGDLVFLNDLFPKDWQSYFIGRDTEYLKAPSDAVKVSAFTEKANVDVVYTPRFDPDRYVSGSYLSYWQADEGTRAGRNRTIDADEPDRWFRDDEIAIRIYSNFRNYELALYGYHGFWKQPAGRKRDGTATFPPMNVYGASARGQVAGGIGNLEMAYYQSIEDSDGSDPLRNNSELRYLVGYSRDLSRDFHATVQHYAEQLLHYQEYRESLYMGPVRDRIRHVITLNLSKLAMQQNLALSMATYYSPSDKDGYLRPIARYNYADDIILELGSNIFFGSEKHTFFGQLENNSNIYTAIRYSR